MRSNRAVPYPRNQSKPSVSVSLDAEVYDLLREATRGRELKDSVNRILRTFLELPRDAQEVYLSDLSSEVTAAAIQAIMRRRRKGRK